MVKSSQWQGDYLWQLAAFSSLVHKLCFVSPKIVKLTCYSSSIISRVLKSGLGGSVQVSGNRCLCDTGKVVSVLCNFQVTVECSFVCACNSSEFCLSGVSKEVSKYVFHGQTQVFFFFTRKEFWKCSVSERDALSCLGRSNAPSCVEWHFSSCHSTSTAHQSWCFWAFSWHDDLQHLREEQFLSLWWVGTMH